MLKFTGKRLKYEEKKPHSENFKTYLFSTNCNNVLRFNLYVNDD